MKTYTKTAELKKGVSVTLATTVYRETISLDGTVVGRGTKLLKEAIITVDGKDINCGHDYGYALTQDAKEHSSYRPECVAVIGDIQLTEKTWMIVQDLERRLYQDIESDYQNIPREMKAKTSNNTDFSRRASAGQNVCEKCGSYCYGDCSSNE